MDIDGVVLPVVRGRLLRPVLGHARRARNGAAAPQTGAHFTHEVPNLAGADVRGRERRRCEESTSTVAMRQRLRKEGSWGGGEGDVVVGRARAAMLQAATLVDPAKREAEAVYGRARGVGVLEAAVLMDPGDDGGEGRERTTAMAARFWQPSQHRRRRNPE
ncbi:hypothetical protein PR202_ga03642 [Eleusine coracana subsp. coracana]|uniref:Uncharacterized protein n=1 Tax=Eleusine coracana subsp. coracana TaxID=191504 RepID=A0AAV5BPL4_ELECO|nr:hypothetical protein PR202_ga03642 [Eleusine coracana subsp. coracana]